MSKPIFPWPGGKRRLAKHILPLFPKHHCYVEPFAGAAAIFFMKAPSKVEVINDINSDVTNLYRVVRHHLDELVRHFRWALVSREEFLTQLNVDPGLLTDIQRAARFYYLQRTCFGAKVEGRTFGTAPSSPPKFNLLRIEEDLSQAHLRLARCYIENLPWEACVKKYDRPDTLFFCDPPYWQTTGYGNEFGFENYVRLAELVKSIKGSMVITVNDIPEMREVFAGLDIRQVALRHTVGGAGGVGRGELVVSLNRAVRGM